MARATRSTTTHEKDKTQDQPQTSRKGASKKRKRNSNAENEESPASKHPRTETKEEVSPDPEDRLEDKKEGELLSSGDTPLQDADAANILEVLEMVDTQGLLDRVFPLPTDSVEGAPSGSSSTVSSAMLSLRTLLKSPSQYPMRIFQAAIKHLHPISSHPRFRPSETTVQQHRFCDLATSLLDQASRNNAPVSLSAESIIAVTEAEEQATSPSSSTHELAAGVRPRKYALVQHLPTGDWWSSVSSEVLTADGMGRDLRTLHTARAELVSIFPSPSGQALAQKGTLGDYVVKRRPNQYRPPQPRRISCGKFLDYGPYASFAPYFDQDGVEVGRVGMGEVIFYQEMKRRLRSLAKGKRRAFLAANDAAREDVVMEDASSSEDATAAGPSQADDAITKGLELLLAPEEVSSIKTALGSLEMEKAVDELLQRNAKALQNLEELQLQRLRAQGGGSNVVEVGSEEWDVAQGITDSLALLASLRPRPSNGDPEHAPLIPPASVLHKLQRTLPLAATEGWYGNLPEGRTTAFHDDTTVHMRASTAAAASKPVAAPATPAPKATTPAPPYTPYSYGNTYQSTQYRSSYGTYTPAQGSYYPNSSYSTATSQATPVTTSTHYPNAQYGTGHSQYYSGWYGNSGRSTPQPGQTGMSGNFASYFAPGTAQQPQPQRAVANTVLSSAKQPYQQQSTWNGTTQGAYVAPTLPAHMRTAAGGASTPGTPSPATGTGTGTYGYYGGYGAPR
ncbi:hypothetical protein L226DRAFT_555785 [Lentinus tigrinus ALCF2SS1-7]|uniref:Uncharacterized protein n=1 Tax=Lentinus tigrinus ALCF2SS1-6 TaxID=1328759 RepID=A0A5C2S446_9APHY|nr:hypothetical protein L227DRAFT_594323 [Lentinus tigrinus ALCF2SS1-6]RPD81624.1 hypothetical protein L226DRAFT_555785 [Lentinus tigrinus ALCF2SS1-7]